MTLSKEKNMSQKIDKRMQDRVWGMLEVLEGLIFREMKDCLCLYEFPKSLEELVKKHDELRKKFGELDIFVEKIRVMLKIELEWWDELEKYWQTREASVEFMEMISEHIDGEEILDADFRIRGERFEDFIRQFHRDTKRADAALGRREMAITLPFQIRKRRLPSWTEIKAILTGKWS